jgi:hypothetical protein
MDIQEESLEMHRANQGKLAIINKCKKKRGIV